MKAAMDELAPGHNIKLKLSTDGSGRGAAIAAAMACQMEVIWISVSNQTNPSHESFTILD